MKNKQTNTRASSNNIDAFEALMEEYAALMSEMASIAGRLKDAHGNKVIEILSVDRAFFLKLYALSKLSVKRNGLSPEHLVELAGRADAAHWAAKARRNKWKPTELRMNIRRADADKVPLSPRITKETTLPRQIILLKNRIARLPDEKQRDALLAMMKNL